MKSSNNTWLLFLFVGLSTLFITTTSCSKDDDKDDDSGNEFAGAWSGTYTGDDAGTFQVTINSQGSISGNGASSLTGESFTLSGSVDNSGDFSASIGSTSSGASFNGSISGSSMSGTWQNPIFDESGTFTGNKVE